MKRRLKEPFGKAGLIVGVLALVFAMLGGAYAATGGSGGGKATASAKAKQGKPGKPGKQGPPGATGPAGPAGPKGDPGAAGSNGTNGTNGAPGTPGKNGTNGKNGEPWTPNNTLPSGATETGLIFSPENTQPSFMLISFPIPLSEPLVWSEEGATEPKNQVHWINPSGKENLTYGVEIENPPDCPGTYENPEAAPGNLCIYFQSETAGYEGINELIVNPLLGATTAGAATVGAKINTSEHQFVGAWAVTGK